MNILRSRKVAAGYNENNFSSDATICDELSAASCDKSSGHDSSGKLKLPPINKKLLSYLHWIFVSFYLILIYYIADRADTQLVKPLPSDAPSHVFSEGRARLTLGQMVGYGWKPSGSYEAEYLTKNFILREVERIRLATKPQHEIVVDVQKAEDCYEFHFLSNFVHCYKNITNLVVKFSPTTVQKGGGKGRAGFLFESPPNLAVLVNCHFDSVAGSPGATDDLAACSVMLEMMYVLSQSDTPLAHSVIFLFNGAEENFLQGSHAFITKHKWRHEVRAFINMEGAGAGGREFLFQSGPANTWLLHTYLDNAKYPHGSILAQEVFESGIIISDTDFRVFRDYGRLSGLDLAFTRNSYLYHTEFDDVNHIAPGSLQQLGDNMLATLKSMANSPCLGRACPDKEEKIVFFDVLGLFTVQYPRKYATPFNYLVCLLVVLKIYFRLKNKGSGSAIVSGGGNDYNSAKCSSLPSCQFATDLSYSLTDFAFQAATMLLSLLAVFLTTILATQFVNIFSLNMFWHNRWLLLPIVYVIPQTCTGLSVHLWFRLNYRPKDKMKKDNPFTVEQLNFDVALSILALILFIITSSGVQSTYYVLLHVLFPLFRDLLIFSICKFGKISRSANVIFACQILLMFPVVVISSYAIVEVLNIFIPLMGRSGAAVNPEYLISGICFIVSVSCVLFLSNFAYISYGIKNMVKWLFVVNLFAMVIMCFPGVVEPFAFSTEAPTWRRLHVQHVRRSVPSGYELGAPVTEEYGLWIAPLDFRGVKDLPANYFLEKSRPPVDYCEKLKFDHFCALPYYIPARKVVPPLKTLWIPTPQNKPRFSKKSFVKHLATKRVGDDRAILDLEIRGTDHISAYFTGLNEWFVDYFVINGKTVTLSEVTDTHFLYLASVHSNKPWKISVALFTTNTTLDDKLPILYVGSASHEMHGPFSQSDMLKNVTEIVSKRRKRSHPNYHWKWAMTVNSWSSDYMGIFAFFKN